MWDIDRFVVRRTIEAVILGALAALAVYSACAQRPSRDDVQAAYLYNFGRFVRWPEGAAHGPILVCVAGQDPFGQTIAKLVAGEQINGRPVEERNLDRPEGVGLCSMLFIGATEQEWEDSFLAAAEGKAILTVGETRDFLVHGGMIQFVMVEDHVRFAVNLEAANHHRVALSSELLKVAVSVTGRPETGGTK